MRNRRSGTFLKFNATGAVSVQALLVGLGVGGAAYAQEASQEASDEKPKLEEILVTGSRLVQTGFEAPTPLTVLSAENLEKSGAPSIAEALREMPSLIKTTGPTAAPSISPLDQSATVGTFLNLRNLGGQRNLLLMDGQRVPPTRADGLTNAQVIPQLLVSRVEVVTGGASAAYGSDAVTGVINYIMDNNFTGLKGYADGGMSGEGDMKNYRFGIAGGRSFFDGRLHAVASAEYRNNDGIDSQCDRTRSCEGWGWGGVNGGANGGLTPTNAFIPYRDALLARLPYSGRISGVYNTDANLQNPVANPAGNALLLNQVFSDNGTSTGLYNPGTVLASATCLDCDGSNWIPSVTTLVPSQEDFQTYASFEFEATPDVTLFGKASYGKDIVDMQQGASTWQGNGGINSMNIFTGNAYLPQSVQNAMVASGATYFTLDSERDTRRGDIQGVTFHGVNENVSASLGARGNLGDIWKWKISGMVSESNQITGGRIIDNNKLAASLDAVRDSSGNIVCRVALTNPGLYPGCAPLNMFGVGSPSAAAQEYIKTNYLADQQTTLQGGGGELSGRPFSTWAGPVGIAVGAEYRRQELNIDSNASDPQEQTGIRYGNMSRQNFMLINIYETSGHYSVQEAFGEIDVPLVKDFSIGNFSVAQALSINAAYRWADYSTSGAVEAWKVGTNWQVSDDIRFRATRSRDVRAPTLNDLFAPVQRNGSGLTDIHTGGTFGSVTTQTQGNLDLKPELADTWTVGTVISPSFLPGFTLSVDWYKISIDNAIQNLGAEALVGACEASAGTSPLCASVIRPGPFSDRSPLNFPTLVLGRSFNAVQLNTEGLDFEASYVHDLGPGSLNLHLLANNQYRFGFQNSPVVPLVNTAGHNTTGVGPSPKLVMSASIGYQTDRFGINVQERRIGEWSLAAAPGTLGSLIYYENPVIDAVYYTDLNFTYDFDAGSAERMQVFFNVGNVFDEQPPLTPTNVNNPGIGYPTQRLLYDIIGRDFTAGVRFQF